MENNPLQRRSFIKKSAAFSSILMVKSSVLGQGNSVAPNDRLNVVAVGAGGKGSSDIGACAGENVIGLADVDKNRAAKSIKSFPGAEFFSDYRVMFDELGNDIDAVTVSTPDHSHFHAALRAINMGKHVYVQKPLTHSIWEARELLKAAREKEVMTQMGNQGHAGEGTRLLKEWVEGGVIGDVTEVHCWTNRPIWPQGLTRKPSDETPPDYLDFDLWLGPAPEVPYSNAYCPFKWRGWWDYGTGALGDMGCHLIDASYWALELGTPDSVEATHIGNTPDSPPTGAEVTYTFPARGDKPPVTLKWFEGSMKPPIPKDLGEGRELAKGGQLIFGDKGTIMDTTDYCRSPRIIPEIKMREMARSLPEKTLARVPDANPHLEWINAIKGTGPTPGSNFEYSVPLTEMVLLGNLAIRAGKKIEWDSENLKAKGVPEADEYIRRAYRAGWDIG